MKNLVIVQHGDTLWGLAKKHLGDAERWKEIWELNKSSIENAQKEWRKLFPAHVHVEGPDWIFPGMILTLPELDDED